MSKNTTPILIKRWGMIDTINACLLIISILFLFDFKNQPALSYILIIAFTIWFISLVGKNIYLSKNRNDKETINKK
ncbi:MAG TPA: hypothetical protein DCO67_00615 [Staphylococcus sp.]|uniref:Uncharacterized protein n=1 Tax=Mammaliicoccus vitulinus TaxID=71237 RepID=A0ABX7HG44_9STAP|nr:MULTISPECIES: hypothetical protein [Mammaliicoccus]HAL08459.1 hypothetical protein [Staphylococcus sp.]MBM6629837.1 hypothetical protein [Mammaliicoccus vitulinus]MEB7657567.1 hypothetical protein [Mammaliicoccus vitulinus]PNZ35179.1 hypothetical protein CD107_11470 [Mammaliicoccus vitulinus]PTI38186.1 hypothetical protein BU074_02385 [Mammaliicoccus vitulinus]